MRPRLLLAALFALALVAPARAAAPWSTPVDVGPPGDYVEAPSLAFSPTGTGLAGWLVRAQPPGSGGLPGAFNVNYQGDNDGYTSRLAALGAGATLGTPRVVPDIVVAGPALDGAGRGLLLRSHILSSDPNGHRRQRVTWASVTAHGLIGQSHPLVTATLSDPPSLVVDARGDAVAAWSEYRPPKTPQALWGSFRIRAAWRRAGHAFGSPVTLFVTQALDYEHNGAVTAAIGRTGRAIVVFPDAHETRHGNRRFVYAWTRTAGSRFGPTLTVGRQAGFARVGAAVTDQGRAIVAWGTQDGGEEANRPWTVYAAALAPDARRFGATQTLDPGAGVERPFGGVALATGPGGRATVAWSAVRGSGAGLSFPAMTATSDPTGRFAPAQTLAPSGAVGGVAVRRRDGAAIVTWANVVGIQQTNQAMAAVRPAGSATFGAPEAIADPDVADPPTVAFDPVTGRPTAAWPARPNGVDPSRGVGPTAILRVATRAAP
jgi:hypothetical protein